MTLKNRSVLLIIGGGIAAYKSLDLIRRLQERGASVRVVMTDGAQNFVTPLAAGALSADRVFTDLWDREDETDVGHIRLARGSDLIVVAPATANLMAKMANGIADDLASAVLLAATVPILLAPAMNPAMWNNPATKRNATTLRADGIAFTGPESGEMAEKGEAGVGRMSEPVAIADAVEQLLAQPTSGGLKGKRVLVTSGPTHEPIDPVRYIANRSSGRQGHAIAQACADAGAEVTLVSGPVSIADPSGVNTLHVETADEMHRAVHAAMPVDVAIFVAAVADYRVATASSEKIKKSGENAPALELVENPDILASIGTGAARPPLVIGFAAETNDLERNAGDKLKRKGADLIVANDVGSGSGIGGAGGVMGGPANRVSLLTVDGIERWPEMSKDEVARRLAEWIANRLGD